MSYDRQIDQVCPHLVAEEALFVGTDQRTVRPMKPIASLASMSVRFNGQIQVPSFGVRLPATATGAKEGPFTIVAGVNDTLAFRVDQGPLQQVTFSPASAITPARLAHLLTTKFTGVSFFASGLRISFRTLSEGSGASLFFDSSSTMTSLLGFPAPREFRGQTSVPGWTLVRDPSAISDRPLRFVVFDGPLRGYRDFVELSYTTVRQDCRRCGGIGVENDWRYGRTGETVQVRDEALLLQEIQKLFLTSRGSNVFHTFYGTTIIDAIGKKLTAGGLVQNLLFTDIVSTFKAWQDLKGKQETQVGQFVSDEEFPYRLLDVDLLPSDQDPTVVFLMITVQNRSQKAIVLERGLKLPAAFDIASFQQGTIRQSIRKPVIAG